ncbi:MAG: hypothetical protein Q9227_009566, partial [Pyrenula ochraceoflavens]
MDSDEEYFTDRSSQADFEMATQDSDDGSFGEDFEGDEEEVDVGFSQDKDIIRPAKKPFEVDYKVLSPGDIHQYQNEQIDEVCSILGLPPESIAILLRFMRWNKERLIETYMDREDQILRDAGLGPEFAQSPKTMAVPGFTCGICYEDEQGLQTYAMICGHRYCVDCYRHYLTQKIKEEGEAARIQCPNDQCHRIVDSKSLKLIVDADAAQRYDVLLTRTWYNCNRFEEKSGSEARDAQAKSRYSLERYLHYYNRYANHEQSAKLDKDLYLKTEKKMQGLQAQSKMSWIEVQFLETASQALQLCRQTLKWTYAFAFYLARNNQTAIFEDNQKDLEMAVESLSEMFEKPTPELKDLKVDILDKTAYCTRRRIILLSDTAERLAK